ncbi:hypothetical protein CEP52_003260 [Fusarium oligoseptatum]|uniref:Uncharacterized protein n=2 Tax=Fusarium solani species complex TaxID=232080 RepID=A0A428U9N2_9HYPO|nr:hypothetical protein CEP51_005755 [Fusarium floridanum]RSM10946.1 hypothetical protein CEP52_003260 [Fusarium oligoseptatum]
MINTGPRDDWWEASKSTCITSGRGGLLRVQTTRWCPLVGGTCKPAKPLELAHGSATQSQRRERPSVPSPPPCFLVSRLAGTPNLAWYCTDFVDLDPTERASLAGPTPRRSTIHTHPHTAFLSKPSTVRLLLRAAYVPIPRTPA